MAVRQGLEAVGNLVKKGRVEPEIFPAREDTCIWFVVRLALGWLLRECELVILAWPVRGGTHLVECSQQLLLRWLNLCRQVIVCGGRS